MFNYFFSFSYLFSFDYILLGLFFPFIIYLFVFLLKSQIKWSEEFNDVNLGLNFRNKLYFYVDLLTKIAQISSYIILFLHAEISFYNIFTIYKHYDSGTDLTIFLNSIIFLIRALEIVILNVKTFEILADNQNYLFNLMRVFNNFNVKISEYIAKLLIMKNKKNFIN